MAKVTRKLRARLFDQATRRQRQRQKAAPVAPATQSRSSTTTKRRPSRKVQEPIHPGEVLAEDFLRPMGITEYRLAKGTRVPPRRINEIVHGTRAVTADTALRLARFFGTSEQFWLNLQTRYDLEKERDRLGTSLVKDVVVWSAVARSG